MTSKHKRNGWKAIVLLVIAGVGFLFLLADRGVFSGLWVSPADYDKHRVEYNTSVDEIKDDLADQKLLLYELKTKVEMMQASLYRVEDKLGTERTTRRHDTSRTE